MSECLFCDEVEKGENRLVDDDLFVARVDHFPLMPGHAEVLPKRHVQFVEQLTDEELGRMMNFVKEVMQTLRSQSETPIEGFTLGVNDGPAAGQTIPHLHLHIIPRRIGDVENPRGGIRHMFGYDEYSQGQSK